MAKRKRSGSDKGVSMDVDYTELDKAARAVPRALDAETEDALRELGDRVVDASRRKVRSGPGRHGGRTNSREQAARGIDYKVRDGRLLLTSDASKMAPGRNAFPAAYNQSSWVHPVFGRRDRVTQRGERDYFAPARFEDDARNLLEKAGDKACSKAGK